MCIRPNFVICYLLIDNRVGGGGSKPAAEEKAPESVFKATKGHSMIDETDKKTKSSQAPAAAPGGKRVNPWADPSFKPTSVVDDSKAVDMSKSHSK